MCFKSLKFLFLLLKKGVDSDRLTSQMNQADQDEHFLSIIRLLHLIDRKSKVNISACAHIRYNTGISEILIGL